MKDLWRKIRRKLILFLAKDDIIVILNAKTYDVVLQANIETRKSCLFRNNRVVRFDQVVEEEMIERVRLAEQGVRKSGDGYVLDPSLLR